MTRMDPARRDRLPVIGVLGAVASGKSTVARLLAEEVGELVDADVIGHEVLELPEVKKRVRERFGDEVLTRTGSVDREALGRLVFASPERLQELNAIVHPLIIDIIEQGMRDAAKDREAAFVVLDAALLMEKGLDERWCDVLVFVEAEEAARLDRARRERAWSAEQVRVRDAAQIPVEDKKRNADFVVGNNGTRKQLEESVRALMRQISTKLSLLAEQGRGTVCSPAREARP